MKTIKIVLIQLIFLLVYTSCTDFLNVTPKGMVTEDLLNSPEQVDKMCLAAYAELGNDHFEHPNSNWPHGDVRSDDSYKGGSDLDDSGDYRGMDLYTSMYPSNGWMDKKWWKYYCGISRVHRAMNLLHAVTEEVVPMKNQRLAEMKFLRGWYYFQMKVIWKYFPYVDETIDEAEYALISNRQFSDDELWSKIAADFRDAAAILPEKQDEVGRPDKYAAKAFLAKTLLYQAYEQNESHAVVNINKTLLEEVVTLTGDIIDNSHYELFDDFGYNFLYDFDNGKESMFAIQRSLDDGTSDGRIDGSSLINHPMYGDYGCCGFHVPSQNLVNVFRTSAQGIPLFDSFNEISMIEKEDFLNNNVDPRLDHTVGIPGHIWKYDPALIYEESWARSPVLYGPYLSMKEIQHFDCPCFKKVPPFMSSSKNTVLMRYADVLLFRAEALIELNRESEALPLINRIRARAAQSDYMLGYEDGTTASTYKVEEYRPGVNCSWTPDFARQALRFERRLEFAMEGYRFFDLTRWGIAADVLNEYLRVEVTRKSYYTGVTFTKGKDEYLPIPQNQINYSEGKLKQNPGYL